MSEVVEKYWVASDNEGMPYHIFFNEEEAFSSKYLTLDTFDENGNYITTYEKLEMENWVN